MSSRWKSHASTAVVSMIVTATPGADAARYKVNTNVVSITHVAGLTGNQTFVTLAAALEDGVAGACEATQNRVVAFDATTDQGKALLSLATAALLSGRLVTVAESGGTCQILPPSWGTGETAFQLSYLELK